MILNSEMFNNLMVKHEILSLLQNSKGRILKERSKAEHGIIILDMPRLDSTWFDVSCISVCDFQLTYLKFVL